MQDIKLTWVEWSFPHNNIGRWNAHVKLPDKDETACGIPTTLAKGVREIGKHKPMDRPGQHRCCRQCLRFRAAVAEQMRLAMWIEAAR